MGRTNPGDVANLFIRCLLSDAGEILGGFSDEHRELTMAYFDGKCPYTGVPLKDVETNEDHIIGHNKKTCGLHLYGNILVVSKNANAEKGSLDFEKFILEDQNILNDINIEVRQARVNKIKAFIEASGYHEKIRIFGDLVKICAHQYDVIKSLCKVNKGMIGGFVPTQAADLTLGAATVVNELAETQAHGVNVLPIYLIPNNPEHFKEELLRSRMAEILITYQDGRTEIREWRAHYFTIESDVMGNLRSRREFRQGNWQENNIRHIKVEVRKVA